MFTKRLVLGLVAGAVCAGAVVAQTQTNPAVNARKAQMQLHSFHVGVLNGMAQGNTPYNADTARAAAQNLAAVTSTDWNLYFPPGTAVGEVTGTRALPAIWQNLGDVMARKDALATAAAALAGVAGDGQAALQGAMGAVTATCGGCHGAYRGPAN